MPRDGRGHVRQQDAARWVSGTSTARPSEFTKGQKSSLWGEFFLFLTVGELIQTLKHHVGQLDTSVSRAGSQFCVCSV